MLLSNPACHPRTLQSLPPEVREAKFVGLAALRAEMYDRNLQVLQRMLGERYMYHKKSGKSDDPSAYKPYYIEDRKSVV